MTVYDYRQDFPLLRENKTVYIDNAATAQRPDCVLEAEKRFYETANANPLRGFYPLSLAATLSSTKKQERPCRNLFMRNLPKRLFYKKYDRKLKFGGIQLRPFKPA